VPTDLSYCSFNLVGILEYHHGLGGYGLRQMFWLLAIEVLLEEINFIVLTDALLSACDEVLSSLSEPVSWVSV
jgi:hypothetical protein